MEALRVMRDAVPEVSVGDVGGWEGRKGVGIVRRVVWFVS